MDREGGVLLVLESRELVEISPFGRIAARPLAVAPRAALPLDPVPRTKDEPAPEGNPALIFTGDGGVFISRWGVPAEPLPALGGLALDGPALDGTFLAVEGWEDTAAVVLSSGRLHLFTVPGGDPLWSDETHLTGERDAGEVRIRHDGRGIYVLSTSGATGFTKDGRKRWLIRIKGAAAVPAFSDEGFLYSCGKDRTLYSYHLEERTGSARRSPYGKTPGKIYDTAAAGFRSSFREEDGVSFDEKDIRDRLAHIGQMIGAGTIGEEEPRFTAYLMELAGSAGVLPLWDRPSRPTPVVQPNYRIEALRYLGRLGSRETIPFLVDLYQRDRDGAIKVAAAAAIGGIGTDPEGRALRAFSALVFPVELYQDAAVLTATAAATGALCRFSGPQSSSPGIRILAALRRGRHSRSVQARAQAELESLR
jgi:outer membrane protein assembly factor BamB